MIEFERLIKDYPNFSNFGALYTLSARDKLAPHSHYIILEGYFLEASIYASSIHLSEIA